MSNQTLIKPIIYFEEENFQSVKNLKENFSYPFFDGREVKSPAKAIAAENDTARDHRTYNFYLLNSVVCLEDEWYRPFKFIGESINKIKNLINKKKSEDDLYECDEPIFKLNLDKFES